MTADTHPVQRRHTMPFGAEPTPHGVRFRLWAPGAQTVDLAWRRPADRCSRP